jgi:hypothetical protein
VRSTETDLDERYEESSRRHGHGSWRSRPGLLSDRGVNKLRLNLPVVDVEKSRLVPAMQNVSLSPFTPGFTPTPGATPHHTPGFTPQQVVLIVFACLYTAAVQIIVRRLFVV